MNIVGVSGLPRSGKDTFSDLLIESGWYGFSFGDYVRKQARARHAAEADPISVKNMTETSNWLRKKEGPDVVLKHALQEFETATQSNNYYGLVLYSIRAPIEADWILQNGGELVWVETKDEIRHKRTLAHLRDGEQPIPFKEFKRQEELQWQPQPGIPAEVQMNTSYVKSKATMILENNAGLEDFIEKAKKIIKSLTN